MTCVLVDAVSIKDERINYQSKHKLYSLSQALAACFELNQFIVRPKPLKQNMSCVLTDNLSFFLLLNL